MEFKHLAIFASLASLREKNTKIDRISNLQKTLRALRPPRLCVKQLPDYYS